MKRRLLKLGVFLLLGAIVNVAVAWGGAIWEPQETSGIVDVTADVRMLFSRFGLELPRDSHVDGFRGEGWGLTFTSAVAEGDPEEGIPDNLWILTEAGWPWRTCAGIFHLVEAMGQKSQASFHFAVELSPKIRARNAFMPQLAFLLPLRPIWPGFAINTLFYGAILALLFYAPGKVRRWIRFHRSQCPACGHIIAAGTCANGLCSECGSPLPKGFKPKPEASAHT